MKSILITYQLNNYQVDYPRIKQAIKNNSSWAKIMDRVWIIKTDKKNSEIRDSLKESILHGGSIFVIDVTQSGWASLAIPGKVSAWIKANL